MEIADIDVEAMAQQALEAWGLQSAKHELVLISENIVFRVETGDGKVLRLCLHRSWYHNLQELISECQWTRALSEYGISTPIQVPALDGNDYVLVRDNVSGEARYASMNQWVDGEIMGRIVAHSEDFTVHFKRMGEMAAQIHNQASNWKPPPGFTRHSLDAEGFMGDKPFWGPFWASPALTSDEQKKFAQLRETVYQMLTRLDTNSDNYSMIHADLTPLNLVINGEHLHVIDFDDAGFGWHMYELAVGVFSYQDHPRFPDMVKAVFEGYRQGRQLEKKSADLLPLFLLIRALASVGWVAARPELSKVSAGRYDRYGRWVADKALSLSADLGF
jgi:Ser/Thr protein kinase RdoA (MazF antagonist)